jgi:hypothetical protein
MPIRQSGMVLMSQVNAELNCDHEDDEAARAMEGGADR